MRDQLDAVTAERDHLRASLRQAEVARDIALDAKAAADEREAAAQRASLAAQANVTALEEQLAKRPARRSFLGW